MHSILALAVSTTAAGAADLAVTTIVESGDALPGPAGLTVPFSSNNPFWFSAPSTDGTAVSMHIPFDRNGRFGLYQAGIDGVISVLTDPIGTNPDIPPGGSDERHTIVGGHTFFTAFDDGSFRRKTLAVGGADGQTRAIAQGWSEEGDAFDSRLSEMSAGRWVGSDFLVLAEESRFEPRKLRSVDAEGSITTVLTSGDELSGIGIVELKSALIARGPGADADGNNLVVQTSNAGLVARIDDTWHTIDAGRPSGLDDTTFTIDGSTVAFRTQEFDVLSWWQPGGGLTTIGVGDTLADGAIGEGFGDGTSFAIDVDHLGFLAETNLGDIVYRQSLLTGDLQRLMHVGVDTINGGLFYDIRFGFDSLENDVLAFSAAFGGTSGTAGIYTLRIPAPATVPLVVIGLAATRRRGRLVGVVGGGSLATNGNESRA